MTARFRRGFTVGVILCVLGSPALAEDSQPTNPEANSPKVQTKKPAPPKKKAPAAPTTTLNSTEDAAAKARLDEARKKFFEQQQGFTDTTPAKSGTSLGLGLNF